MEQATSYVSRACWILFSLIYVVWSDFLRTFLRLSRCIARSSTGVSWFVPGLSSYSPSSDWEPESSPGFDLGQQPPKSGTYWTIGLPEIHKPSRPNLALASHADRGFQDQFGPSRAFQQLRKGCCTIAIDQQPVPVLVGVDEGLPELSGEFYLFHSMSLGVNLSAMLIYGLHTDFWWLYSDLECMTWHRIVERWIRILDFTLAASFEPRQFYFYPVGPHLLGRGCQRVLLEVRAAQTVRFCENFIKQELQSTPNLVWVGYVRSGPGPHPGVRRPVQVQGALLCHFRG